MYFKNNFKAIVIGNSSSGKTYYVVNLINDILGLDSMLNGSKRKTLCVICPNEASLNQPLWNNVRCKVDKILLKNNTPKPDKHDFYVIDDVDILKGKSASWITELFTIESHHTASTVIWICHKYNTGSPESRGSVDYLVIKDLDEEQLKKLPIPQERRDVIQRYLNKNVFYDQGEYKNYAHVVYVKCCMPSDDNRIYRTDVCFLNKISPEELY